MEQYLPTLPPYFFKYRPFNDHTIETILESKIYFQSPAKFNDPFDGRIPLVMSGSEKQWSKYLNKLYKESYPGYSPAKRLQLVSTAMKSGSFKTIENKKFDDIVDSLGVLCLTANATNILMWAHYADSHKGVCLRFNPNNNFFSEHRRLFTLLSLTTGRMKRSGAYLNIRTD